MREGFRGCSYVLLLEFVVWSMVWGELTELYVLLCLLVCRTKCQHVTHVSQSGTAIAAPSPGAVVVVAGGRELSLE